MKLPKNIIIHIHSTCVRVFDCSVVPDYDVAGSPGQAGKAHILMQPYCEYYKDCAKADGNSLAEWYTALPISQRTDERKNDSVFVSRGMSSERIGGVGCSITRREPLMSVSATSATTTNFVQV